MNPREQLIYLALMYKGDRRKIIDHITRRLGISHNAKLPKMPFKALTFFDEDYPEEFKQYGLAPLVLFYYGDISLIFKSENNIAVVGTRKPTEYGIKKTEEIVKELAKDYVIVSGLASGIDAIAHKSAIEVRGKTVAVLGCGIDRCYPSENQELYEEIKKNHLVISEYPYMDFSSYDSFPFRNRLIAMFSKGVFISQASYRSGTSITASFALEFSKDVMCLPYPADEMSLCNRLIGQGAFLVENAKDIDSIMNGLENGPIFEN